MPSTITSVFKTAAITAAVALFATASRAQEVELSARDGSLNLRGQLIDFVDDKYTIETSAGRMTVDASNMLCSGEACPADSTLSSESSIPVAQFSIVGLGLQASEIMPNLLSSYAQSINAQMNSAPDGSYVLTNSDDEQIAVISLFDTFSSNSLSDVPSRQAAIALTSESLSPEEIVKLGLDEQADESAVNSQVMGLNAITIITANVNPIKAISMTDVARIFSGEYDNWSDLGGRNAPITLYGPQPDSELAKSFEAQILSTGVSSSFQLSQDFFFFDNVAQRVAVNPNGIGYAYFADSKPAKTLNLKGVCGMTIPANSFAIKAEEYPLTQRLYAYRLGQTDVELADELLSFMQSDAGQDSISSNGLVNQLDTGNSILGQGSRFANAILANSTDTDGELLKEMVAQIIDSERLSTTFRFETGSDQMDQRARADILRVAEKLQSPRMRGRNLHLIGFTDSVGDFDLNREVSLRRANQIRDALIDVAPALAEQVSILPAGFGEIAPVACNETARGRSMNRRVEVWTD